MHKQVCSIWSKFWVFGGFFFSYLFCIWWRGKLQAVITLNLHRPKLSPLSCPVLHFLFNPLFHTCYDFAYLA